jgi:hypothetical protein
MEMYCSPLLEESLPVKAYVPCWGSSEGIGSSRTAWRCLSEACQSHSEAGWFAVVDQVSAENINTVWWGGFQLGWLSTAQSFNWWIVQTSTMKDNFAITTMTASYFILHVFPFVPPSLSNEILFFPRIPLWYVAWYECYIRFKTSLNVSTLC